MDCHYIPTFTAKTFPIPADKMVFGNGDLCNTDDLWKEILDKAQRAMILQDTFNWKHLPIKRVIFNKPATIVIWDDGEKTVVKCGEKDEYDEEKGLAMAIVKRLCGNKGRYNEEFKKWIPERQTKKQSAKEKLMQAADEYVKSVMGDTDG